MKTATSGFRRTSTRVALVVGTGLTALALMVSPAQAASAKVYHGSDYGAADNYTGTACDMEADGHGVYAEFVLANGNQVSLNDGNGSASGCGENNYSSKISKVRVCERTVGCSSWKNTS